MPAHAHAQHLRKSIDPNVSTNMSPTKAENTDTKHRYRNTGRKHRHRNHINIAYKPIQSLCQKAPSTIGFATSKVYVWDFRYRATPLDLKNNFGGKKTSKKLQSQWLNGKSKNLPKRKWQLAKNFNWSTNDSTHFQARVTAHVNFAATHMFDQSDWRSFNVSEASASPPWEFF